MGALFGTLAVGQEMPKPAPRTDGDRMTFSDKPEFLVLPRKGEATAVECAVYPPRPSDTGAKRGLVLHFYGRGGSCREYNMMRAPFATVRQLLWERGYWLIVPDLGTDHWMKDAAVKSIDAIIEGMIRDRGVDPHRVHILGTSMGGGCGLIYVMRSPGRVRSICALFPMTDFSQWVKEKPQYLPGIAAAHGVKPAEAASLLQALSPLYHASAFADIPVFLLHGDADPIVPVHHSREFAAALQKQGSPVACREAHGLGHDNAVAEPFQREIVEFLTDTAAQSDRDYPSTNRHSKSEK
jgi:dipeptidyl aminopeptidase/acylaminoacyl peptidase